MHIRQFDLRRDLQAVLQFQHEIYERNFPGFEVNQKFLDDFACQLRAADRSPAEQLWVLEIADQIRGFVWGALITSMIDEFVGYIKNVYVTPELRGQGYGHRLLETAEEWFRTEGAPKAVLDASVCNQQALSLYTKAGYCTERLRMEKPLNK
ncbi:MAG: GNAT family N-acetyltransferase [Armatimonadetes bacterium]|nr:GNAT family N-acetyltransferase [Armatimonadota bacterium]